MDKSVENCGEWKINCDGYYPYCSKCGSEPKNGVMSKYCPNCGVKMYNPVMRFNKPIIDVCCGSKMFWFDKNNPNVEFCDIREIKKFEFYPHRYIEIKPDTICDFTDLPFKDGSYKLVVFDPPHLFHSSEDSLMSLKYGLLKDDWKETLKKGFSECFRVLEDDGVLIFKWSESDVPVKKILELTPQKPLFGNRSGKNQNTIWLCFMKGR